MRCDNEWCIVKRGQWGMWGRWGGHEKEQKAAGSPLGTSGLKLLLLSRGPHAAAPLLNH